MGMAPVKLLCTNCGEPYEADRLYCAACGYFLPPVPADNIMEMTFHFGKPPASAENLQWGTGFFHPHATLSLRFENDLAIAVPLLTKSAILGRNTPIGTVDVDLTPHKGVELGVSRHHARIDRDRDMLHVIDLGSSNGTFLNRQRLEPGVPHILRNRAVLQLSQLTIRVQFT
jgi:FHA domain